jgi:hypothetical protein
MTNASEVVRPSTRPLSEDERLEYSEIGEMYRHDDQMTYSAASVFLPLSYGALVVGAQFPSVKLWVAFFSISLYLYWQLLSVRSSWYSAVRLERARELEKIAGLKHHHLIGEPPPRLKSQLGYHISIRRLRYFFLAVLVAGWIGVLALFH